MLICTIITLLNAVLISTESEPVAVHEWGVVVFGEYKAAVVAVPDHSLSSFIADPHYNIEPISVEAPVIFFHGAEFSGDFVVEVVNGSIYEIYPVDGMISSWNSIRWSDIQVFNPEEFAEYSEDLPLDFLLSNETIQNWRTLECNSVRTSGGINEGFLYYECFLETPEFINYPQLLAAGEGLPEGVDKVLMFLDPCDDMQEMYSVDPQSIFTPVETEEISVYDKRRMMDIFSAWDTAGLHPDELELLWDTWEAYVTEPVWEGDALVVFPLPQDMINRISRLEVLPDGEIEVTYGRFFIGMMPVSWSSY